MSGLDPIDYMHQLSLHMNELQDHEDIERVLEDMEQLIDVVPVEYRDKAETLIALLHDKLASTR